MKVYTHFNYIENSKNGYRWRTLLKFGSSWDIIGSIVMMNPGSANFMYSDRRAETDNNILMFLRKFDNDSSLKENWYEFHSDPTLDLVRDMFSERANTLGEGELNGVIQVFNLFYLREPNLDKGLKINNEMNLAKINDRLFEDDIKNVTAPLYLGFGQLSKNSQFREKAKCYFDKARKELGVRYLNPKFDNNTFMHPRRLMLFMKYAPEGILLKNQFYYNCLSSKIINDKINDTSPLYKIKQTLTEKTGGCWWLYKGWDLGISFNDKTNKIGIESWYGRKGIEDDNCFHIFITVWDSKCLIPYQEELKANFPNCPINNMGLKKRRYLHLPVIDSKSEYDIVNALVGYFNSMSDLTNRIK